NGDTGFKSTTVQTVNNYEGRVFIMPLFKAKDDGIISGDSEAGVENASHYDYNVVRFVAVRIMDTGGQDNKQIIIQPAADVNPYAVFLNGSTPVADPTPGTAGLVTTFTTPRLTR